MPRPTTGLEETAATASRLPSFLTRCTSVVVFSKLLMRPAEALALAPFSSGLLVLLEVGPLLGHHSGDNITAVLLLQFLLNLDGRHCLGGGHSYRRSDIWASSVRSVSSVPAGCAWMVGGSLMVQEDLKNAVPSSPGGQYSTLMICITIMCLGYVIHHFYFTFTYCLKQPSIYVHQKYAEKNINKVYIYCVLYVLVYLFRKISKVSIKVYCNKIYCIYCTILSVLDNTQFDSAQSWTALSFSRRCPRNCKHLCANAFQNIGWIK